MNRSSPSTALWAHLLRKDRLPAPPNADVPAPPLAPLDRNSTSARILLYDTQAHIEKFSTRVEALCAAVQDSKREIATASGLFGREHETLTGDIVDLVNRAQTELQKSLGEPAQAPQLTQLLSRLDAVDKRLDAIQASSQMHAQALQSIQDQQVTILTAVLPLLPLIQAVPLHIDAVRSSLETLFSNVDSRLLAITDSTCGTKRTRPGRSSLTPNKRARLPTDPRESPGTPALRRRSPRTSPTVVAHSSSTPSSSTQNSTDVSASSPARSRTSAAAATRAPLTAAQSSVPNGYAKFLTHTMVSERGDHIHVDADAASPSRHTKPTANISELSNIIAQPDFAPVSALAASATSSLTQTSSSASVLSVYDTQVRHRLQGPGVPPPSPVPAFDKNAVSSVNTVQVHPTPRSGDVDSTLAPGSSPIKALGPILREPAMNVKGRRSPFVSVLSVPGLSSVLMEEEERGTEVHLDRWPGFRLRL